MKLPSLPAKIYCVHRTVTNCSKKTTRLRWSADTKFRNNRKIGPKAEMEGQTH